MKLANTTLALTISALFICCYGYAQELNSADKKLINNFIQLVKEDQASKLAEQVYYPLKREYPIPAVGSKKEFISRYRELFDDSLRKMIVQSDPVKDWSHVGWRGIMLLNGVLWLDSKLISLNYESAAESRIKQELILKDRRSLYADLRNYKRPIMMMTTSKFKLRIDELANGKYRYSSWSLKAAISEKPDLVLSNGVFVADGSGGNHSYRFSSGQYRYNCDVLVLTEGGAPLGQLTVTKSGKVVLKQNATALKN